MIPRGGRALALLLAVPACVALGALRDARADVVLHEYIPAEPAEDVRFGATTQDGTMAAAIQTESGPVASPDPERPRDKSGKVYAAGSGSNGAFHADRDTTRPDTVSYDDPFTPSIAPYKRELAYDTVNDSFDLVVRDGTLTRLSIGGAPRAEDDQFYADLDVDLVEGQPVRIPTAGPGARLFAVRSVPETTILAFRDSADDWFVRGNREGRVRLVLHIAVDRAVFGSPFADTEWTRLWRFTPPIPDRVKAEGIRVARQIGVVDGTGPSEALGILVRYFRGFAPSTDLPKSSGGDLYHELSISKKGVCRHRAYAFVITALALGIPSRFVRNEAHAWVEVFDGARWHRIDLGGAAQHLDEPNDTRVAHVPPRDPYDWPPNSESGQAIAERERAQHGRQGSRASAGAGATGQSPEPSQTPEEPAPNPEDRRPRALVTLAVGGADARRGDRVPIAGRVEVSGTACAASRVDLFLDPKSGAAKDRIPLGTLVTNAQGRYEGRVVVPYGVPPGDYDVRASTPGNSSCGTGESE
jgi:hypothetical protein